MRPSTPSGSRSASRPAASLSAMRRLAPVLIFFVWAAPAHAKPTVSVQATPAAGPAPLNVTLTATGDAVGVPLGPRGQDPGGRAGRPAPVSTGRFTATVTGTAADGTTAQASVVITSAQLTLSGPKIATYGRRATFQGRIAPGAPRRADHALFGRLRRCARRRRTRRGASRSRVKQTAPASYSGALRRRSRRTPSPSPVRPALDVARAAGAECIGRPLEAARRSSGPAARGR